MTALLCLLAVDVSPTAVLSFAEVNFAAGEYSIAAPEYLRYALYFPGDSLSPWAVFKGGVAYGREERYDLAGKYLSLSVRSPGVRPAASLELARVKVAVGDTGGVDALLERSQSDYPAQTALLRSWLGVTRWSREEALTHLKGNPGLEDMIYFVSERWPSERSPAAAGVLSALLPGSGQIYGGRTSDGFMSFIFTALTGGLTYYYYAQERPLATGIAGAFAGLFYVGQLYGAIVGTRAANKGRKEAFMEGFKAIAPHKLSEPPYTLIPR